MEPSNAPQQIWGVHDLSEEIRMLKAAQFEHAERLTQHAERIGRLEQQQEDSKIRSLWSTPSPFPPMLSSGSFSQQPINSEPADDFNGFDEEQQHSLLAGLRLDDVDVPRRGASRANSVRFDDSAIQNHWIHDSQSSNDYFGPRNNSLGGGYPMTERSSSHKSDYKSDGRQSSMRSYGDNSSFFDGDIGTPFHQPLQNLGILDCDAHRPSAPTSGSAPAIIRCWLDTTSSFDSLLYAIVCTGSVRSLVDASLVARFGLQDQMVRGKDGEYKISLAIYLPDATIQQPTRGSGQTQLPRLTVQFTVVPSRKLNRTEDEVGIFLGSDILSDHMGDVLFSQSQLLLYVDDGRKMFVPFARPDAQVGFSDVCTMHIGDQLSDRQFEGSCPQAPTNHQEKGSIVRADCVNGSLKAGDSGIVMEESTTRVHVSVSSPKPVRGRKAAVISNSTSPEAPTVPEETPRKDNCRRNSVHSRASGSDKKCETGRKDFISGFELSNDIGASSNEDEITKESRYTGRGAKSDGEGSLWNSNNIKSNGIGAGSGSAKSTVGVWESWRKGQATQKKDSQTPSRGMKVLRISKSSSLFDARATHQPEGGSADRIHSLNSTTATPPAPPPPPQGFARTNTSLSASGTSIGENATVRTQRRMSSAELHSSTSIGNPALIPKSTSTNVIGGASAFHWMAPKTSPSTVE